MKALYRKAKGAEIWERSWGQGRGAKDLKKKLCINCLGCKSCGILAPQTKEPGIKPVPFAVEAQNFKH